jgi:hypothetical protein
VNEILHTDHAGGSEVFLDDFVGGNGESLFIYSSITSFIDQVRNGLSTRVSITFRHIFHLTYP